MFIAALFINAKSWKQSRCPPVGDWINILHLDSVISFCTKKK